MDETTRKVRERLDRPIAAGLWMTRQAARETLDNPARIERLKERLADARLSCHTMNAFPFGNFHARRVKEQVYLPDWTTSERAEFTRDVAYLLARLIDDPAVEGSISTSPCAFKSDPPDPDSTKYIPKLIETARMLERLREESGRTIRLAIEPEPGCVLETTDEAIAFFRQLWSNAGRHEPAVREFLGVCFDVCHQSIEFEDVADSITRLDREGVRINKVHVTCALELPDPSDDEARRELARFVEERYLHQTFARDPRGTIRSRMDLSRELALDPPTEWRTSSAWRVHFHVPIHLERIGRLDTTRSDIEAALREVNRLDYAPHLEVETYTWSVLPRQTSAASDLVAGLQSELESAMLLLARIAEEAP